MSNNKVPETCRECGLFSNNASALGECPCSKYDALAGHVPDDGCPFPIIAACAANEKDATEYRNIKERYCPKGKSVREYIDWLQDENTNLSKAAAGARHYRKKLAACAAGPWVERVDGVLELPTDDKHIYLIEWDRGVSYVQERGQWLSAIDTFQGFETDNTIDPSDVLGYSTIMGVRDDSM